MGQEVRGIPEAPAVAPAGPERAGGVPVAAPGEAVLPPPSIGRYLARQRRLRGISLDELEALTKIPRRNLQRLEAGSFDSSPDGFARGFVRTVAGALGLDTDEAVMRLLSEPPADDWPSPRSGLRRLALGGALLAAAAGAALGLSALVGALAGGGGATGASEVVYRRDAVRELAREVREARVREDGTPAPLLGSLEPDPGRSPR